MDFDSKQKVLLAVYTEYQKDIPDMSNNITAEKIGLDPEVFDIALRKLENENLINGVKIAGRCLSDKKGIVWTDDIMMTIDGIDYVEGKIGIGHTLTGAEKIKYIIKESASWGWDQIKDIAARTLSEIAKGNQ